MSEKQKTQWLVLRKGEAYEKTLGKYESVFLFREADGWCAWYARWHPKMGTEPVKEFDIVTEVAFEEAVKKANQFIERRGRK